MRATQPAGIDGSSVDAVQSSVARDATTTRCQTVGRVEKDRATGRVELGIGVLVIPYRHPLLTAKIFADAGLQHLVAGIRLASDNTLAGAKAALDIVAAEVLTHLDRNYTAP